MKQFFLLMLFCLALQTTAWAQPVNDDCAGAIDLGVAPFCDANQFFTNELATTSNIGSDNNPTCFNGGLPSRDVWFTFTASDTIEDYAITVSGLAPQGGTNPLIMPQIAIYRGDGCGIDELAEAFCVQSALNESSVTLIANGLNEPGVVYYIRINDYSASAASNEGTFILCVAEYVPDVNMGDADGSVGCFGTLHDSGGPDDEYSNGENLTFTICPSEFHSCIQLDMVSYDMEESDPFFGGGEQLNFYAGEDTNAPLISTVTGTGPNGNDNFSIQVASTCVTVEFISDGSIVGDGFTLTWNCSALPCDGSSPSNPTVITTIPFVQGGFSTCDDASNIGETECNNDAFLLGPDYVFTYTSPGNECVSIGVTGADLGTGIAVFYGNPNDPANSVCVRSVPGSFINVIQFEQPGTYYIVIANPNNCTDFGVNIQLANCALDPSLSNALCNPLNGCAALDQSGNLLPSVFFFDQGFEDVDIQVGVNNGCWLGSGFEPDFYWFTIEAQADGPFGFLFDSADEPTDIDFNVWGPFTRAQVCDSSLQVIDFIANNQPIRSSWTGGVGSTGCTDVHPITGEPVTDEFDCGSPNTPGAGGDRYISTIDALDGEVYVVLVNDFGEGIQDNGMFIDWIPSDPDVLFAPALSVLDGDTSICVGQGVGLFIDTPFDGITWSPSTTLSCSNCPDPIAFPSETTTYQVIVSGVCVSDTANITVGVFALNLGPDVTVCRNEDFQLNVNGIYPNATYSFSWTDPAGFLSCTDCANPVFNANTSGSYTFYCTLTTPLCTLVDSVTINVLTELAPQFNISDNKQICLGESTNIGGTAGNNVTFTWESVPTGFQSTAINPSVSPTETTLYFVTAVNNNCPLPSVDSVLVSVFYQPEINIIADTTLCQGDQISLGDSPVQDGVNYTWSPILGIDDVTNPNSELVSVSTQQYILTTNNGACVRKDTVNIAVTSIAISLINQPDSTSICKGTQVPLQVNVTPANGNVVWTPTAGLNTTTGTSVIATPTTATTYTATVTVGQCIRRDRIYISVDSLPTNNLPILPADTTVCTGALLILKSPVYEPEDFPNIDILWQPNSGFVYSDTLWNTVLNAPGSTTVYSRIVTNGICKDTTSATVNVVPVANLQITPSNPVVCPGESVNLNLTSDQPMQTIEWTPATGLSCTDCSSLTATPPFTINYQVNVESNGCPVSTNVIVEVLPLPSYQFPSDRILCLGESARLNTAGLPGVTYAWSASDGSLSSTAAEPEVSPTTTTTYYLTASNQDCTVQDSVTIVVAIATLNLIDEVTICQGDNIDITAQGSLDGSYSWTPGNINGATVNVGPTTTEEFFVNYVFGDNCFLTDSVTVNVVPAFSINLVADPNESTVPQGQTIALSALTSPSQSNATYSWSENGNLLSANGASTTVNPILNPTVYTVTVTSVDGCTRIASISFNTIEPEYKLPNAFTPDGDQTNDYFNLIYTGNITVLEFKIFNRWGEVVYNNTNPSLGWDGKSNSKEQPSDGYVYMIRIKLPNGKEELLKGDVSLIR